MSSTPHNHQDNPSDEGEHPQILVAQAEAAAAANADQTPDVPPKSPHRPRSEKRPGHSAGQTTHRASDQPSGSSMDSPSNSTTTALQAPGTIETNASLASRIPEDDVETPIEHAPPPAYSEIYGQVDISQDGFDTRARVGSDGRVNININQSSRRLSNLLAPALRSQLNVHLEEEQHPPGYIPRALGGQPGQIPPPPLNVVIHVVGSRGDVQPFVSLGKVLKQTYGHRVRLATHPTFRELVEENGLEFFSIGGDPAELMAFMVKNPGLMPGMDSLRSGDVGKRRKGMYEIVKGCWRSCIEAGDGTGVEASDGQTDNRISFDSGISVGSNPADKPFVADAIIANPPSFAHVHIAEKLGIPLHLMFTMPWSPTQAFPHPLANIQSSNADASLTNFVSYALVEMMTWQGLGDIINRFREKSLGLEAVSLMWAPGMASRLRIPYTYCWSPALIPKPKDWGPHINISGFFFLSLASDYTPARELAAFLDAGPPPIYIGFGSIVVEDPNAMTKLIFEAVKKTGQRALVSKGWGGFGGDELTVPEGVFMLGNVPHDWLFSHVSCVVHHGGAGTTAAGIACGKPTVVVPFFGDQPFWGAMVAKAGAGPQPIPYKQLTGDSLAGAILEALKPTALRKAQDLGAKISSERGSDVGAVSFHDKLDVDTLRCALAPSRAAVWRVKRTDIRLSAFAATALSNEGLLDFNTLKLYRPREYDSEDGPWDPISGGAAALLGTMGSLMMGFADFPVEILRALKVKPSEAPKSVNADQDATPIDQISTTDLTPESTNTSSEAPSLADDRSGSMRDGVANAREHAPSTETIDESNMSDGKPAASPAISTTPHQSSMARAMSGNLTRPGSGKRSSSGSPAPQHRRSLSGSGQISLEAAVGAGKGVGRIVGAGMKSPMDFTLALARGFHNAPKLYGDKSVRQQEKITGIQSGLKVAGKEFGFGLYDGISGLVTQPFEGAKKEGVAGLIKGFGKGIGGVVLKPQAAFWGVPGYAFKGVYKEIQKHMGSSVQNYIIAARTAQGYEEWKSSTGEERLDVISRWHSVQLKLNSGKSKSNKDGGGSPGGFMQRYMSFDEKKKSTEEKQRKKQKPGAKTASQRSCLSRSRSGFDQSHTDSGSDGNAPENSELEEAIQRSVTATSRGDPEQDKLIERAIRASIAELQLASQEDDEQEAINRAIQASVAEAAQGRASATLPDPRSGTDGRSEQDRVLEEALHLSLQEHQSHNEPHSEAANNKWDDSGIETDDDENIQEAIELSKQNVLSDVRSGHAAVEEDQELQKAIEESKQAHSLHEEDNARAKTEEEIVLEHVKKQSLAEQEHRTRLDLKGKSKEHNDSGYDNDDDDFKRAMEESLRISGKAGESSTEQA
ncbi:MAG: hypothetical protein M1830_009725 [Pleopsidium flavum]|nr:MAG: hypothetical protein M1830_009725 [Pleopsidium flavum]